MSRRSASKVVRSAPDRACNGRHFPVLAWTIGLAGLASPAFAQATGAHDEPRIRVPIPEVEHVKRDAEPTPIVESPARAERPDVGATTVVQAKSDPVPDLTRAVGLDRDRVYHLTEDDGTPAVRGATYKARFTPEAAIYIPFLGVGAPRNFPVDFRLAHVAVGGVPVEFDATVAAQRAGDVVRYERGTLVEVFEIGVESIEQLFVFDALPGSGELVLRIATTTELEGRETPERIEFTNELGAVRYGRATALDADGASISAPTTLTASGIEIRVPAAFVASARFPLTIDPVVSTFSIDTNPPASLLPDCAFDASTGRWLVVYEEVFSAADHDVVWKLLGTLSGSILAGGYVDTVISDYWANPSCANNSALNNFFVAAESRTQAASLRKILGKTIDASSGFFGTTLNLGAEDPFVDLTHPDVGGDPAGLPSYFVVVWEKNNGASDHDIYYRMVDPGNSLASGIQIGDISGSTVDSKPSVSKSSDGAAWNVVWQRRSSTMPFQQDIRGMRIGWSGNTISSSFSIDSSNSNTSNPRASTSLNGTSTWAIAYEKDFGSDFDVGVKLMSGTTVLDDASLTGLEVLAGQLPTLLENQVRPDIDSDGRTFAVAYSESFLGSSFDYDVFAATFTAVGGQVHLSEGHRPISTSTTHEDNPSIASTEGAGLDWRLELVMLDDSPNLSGTGSIEGGLYDNAIYTSFCHPTFDGVPACPCNNPAVQFGRGCENSSNQGGAMLIPAGFSSIGGDTMTLSSVFMPATALTIFNQGNAVLPNAAVFGQGLRCVGGSLKRLYMKTATVDGAIAPGPGDPSIHLRSAALGDPISVGSTRAYYAYYRDPTVLGGCPSGSTYNATQSVQAVWLP